MILTSLQDYHELEFSQARTRERLRRPRIRRSPHSPFLDRLDPVRLAPDARPPLTIRGIGGSVDPGSQLVSWRATKQSIWSSWKAHRSTDHDQQRRASWMHSSRIWTGDWMLACGTRRYFGAWGGGLASISGLHDS